MIGIVSCVMMVCISCKTRYIPVETVSVETVEIHDTTIVRELEVYRDSVAMPDTISFLSNPYAYSWARYSNGQLHHSLGIWPNAVIVVKVPYYMERTRRIEVPKVVEVEKKLSWWQMVKIDAGGYSMIANLLTIGLIIVRWIRRKGGRV